MTFHFAEASSQLSDTASIDVDVPQLISSTGRASGFLNVVTESGWVTQNLPILPGYPYPNISSTLTLGSGFGGGIVSSLVAGVCYTDEPLVEAPHVTSDVFAVGALAWNAGGFMEAAPPVVPAAPPVAAVSFQFPGFFAFAVQPGHSNVQAAYNQCGPSAAANGLDWLRATYGTAIPHANVLGLNGAPADSLVGQMDVKMKRTGIAAGNRWEGDAMRLRPQQTGIMQYLWDNDLKNLTLRHQGKGITVGGIEDKFTGVYDFKWPNVAGGLKSTGKGYYVEPGFLFDEVTRGAAIELSAYSKARGGHALTVIGAGNVLGVPFILYVSDHEQTRKGVNGMPVDDDRGTDRIDFSFLLSEPQKQPLIRYGADNDKRALGVLTQRP